ncbi:MAG: hypothetical protein SNJ71_04085, partial [Bacteroidales bacterium]
ARYPLTIYIDYGTSTTGNDGIVRSGKIKITLTGRYRTKGTVLTIEPEDFTRDNVKISGVKTVTNEGENEKGNITFSIKVENAILTTQDGTIQWNSQRKREWIEGSKTLRLYDDVYSITGQANGKDVNGNAFTVTIKEPLIVKLNCPNIVQGILIFEVENFKLSRELDYGNGECDKKATLKVGNQTKEITLK